MKAQNILGVLLLILFTSCGIGSYDNYDPPESVLEGKLVYDQEPIHVSYDNVTFELWQSGFGSMTPINVTVDQDGSYSAVLFDGDYKLVFPQGQGPFIGDGIGEDGSDTLHVQLRGSQQLDIEVTPYFMIRNHQFSISDNTVTANFAIEEIAAQAPQDVEALALYVSKTNYVDNRTSISTFSYDRSNEEENHGDIIDNLDISDITLSTDVPAMTPTQDYVFVRVGVKVSGVEDMIFSPVEKIQLQGE